MQLLKEQFDLLFDSPESTEKLKRMILELAVRGKLVPQDPDDEPASALLDKIQKEKERLLDEGKIKKEKPLPPISEEDIPYELPLGWKWVRLGDIVLYGNSTQVSPDKIKDDDWLLELEDIEKDNSKLIRRVLFSDRNSKSNKNKFKKDDVLYGKLRPYLNKVIVADQEGYSSSEIIPIETLGIIMPSYLMYFLRSKCFTEYIDNCTYGTKMPRLGTLDAKKALVPLPPLNEQQRIVNKIEELFDSIPQLNETLNQRNSYNRKLNTASLYRLTTSQEREEFDDSLSFIMNNFDTLYTNIESINELRQAFLTLAVQGKLVPQDPNDEPAYVLLEKINEEKERLIEAGEIKREKPLPPISEEEIPYELPQDWEWVRLNNVLQLNNKSLRRGPFGSSIRKDMFVQKSNDSFKIYEQKNAIKKDYSLGEYYITAEKYKELKSFAVKAGDIIISCAGTIGETYLLPKEAPDGIINQALLKITLNNEVIINDFFLDLFEYLTQNSIMQDVKGSAMKNMMSVGVLKKTILPLPPLREQKRIVNKLYTINALCNNLNYNIYQNINIHNLLLEAVHNKSLNNDL